jgi:rSAM/selenodomain-associated transferase 1
MNALIVVAKRPAAGHTKTRLSPSLSSDQAAALYECFLRDTLDLMRRVAQRVPHVKPVIAYLPHDAEGYFAKLAPEFDRIVQTGDDLGARLDDALQHYLALGYERVAIMNSDGPTLPVEHLVEAFEGLSNHADVVLGPSDDGGYYLIGLKKPAPRLLRDVQMSTPRVAADTLALAEAEGLRVKLLPVWYDVDDVAALRRLNDELATAPAHVAPHTRSFLRDTPLPL